MSPTDWAHADADEGLTEWFKFGGLALACAPGMAAGLWLLAGFMRVGGFRGVLSVGSQRCGSKIGSTNDDNDDGASRWLWVLRLKFALFKLLLTQLLKLFTLLLLLVAGVVVLSGCDCPPRMLAFKLQFEFVFEFRFCGFGPTAAKVWLRQAWAPAAAETAGGESRSKGFEVNVEMFKVFEQLGTAALTFCITFDEAVTAMGIAFCVERLALALALAEGDGHVEEDEELLTQYVETSSQPDCSRLEEPQQVHLCPEKDQNPLWKTVTSFSRL